MFSRRPDRPTDEPRRRGGAPTGRPGDLVPVPGDAAPWGASAIPAPGMQGLPGAPGGPDPVAVAASRGDATVVAGRDHVEGALRSAQGVLVLGSFSGTIESEAWVRMAEGSTVKADVTAQEVVVAGAYEGRLVATSRLEIAATGHIRGEVEAPRLLLHEGGVIDGALYMTRTDAGRPASRGRAARTSQQATAPDRPAGAGAGTATATGTQAPVDHDSSARATAVRESISGTAPRWEAAAIPVSREPGAPEVSAGR